MVAIQGQLQMLDSLMTEAAFVWSTYDGLTLSDAQQARVRRAKEQVDYETTVAEMHRLTQASLEACRRIKQIIADLSTFVRTDEQPTVTLRAVRQTVRATINLVQKSYQDRIAIVLEDHLSDDGLVRANRLSTVLNNLLINACQASEAVPNATVSVRLSGTDTALHLTVTDRGCGIPGHLIQRIFDPFFTTKEVGQGTGLGLAVCQAIVDSQGGQIRVDSPPGTGTVITVSLPWVGRAATPAPGGAESEGTGSR